jgi:hypothetical protein
MRCEGVRGQTTDHSEGWEITYTYGDGQEARPRSTRTPRGGPYILWKGVQGGAARAVYGCDRGFAGPDSTETATFIE